ncbi:MAG TPA: GNAT family N-acetyltransferase [Candidatus Polarisedimenticolia bacterium]|nr:GNAT family N-acetyltransferase [Candidatus Polarisedimenticolia bacterium]
MSQEGIIVRRLREEDLDAVIAIDARNTGRRRSEYLKLKMTESLTRSGIGISLAAELDGIFTGFLLARVYYGEFGLVEPAAVLDTLGVHPDFQRRGVGAALLDQLRIDLRGLRVPVLRTEVSWDTPELMSFFHHEGFRPAERFCLDLDLTRARPEEPLPG